jgi:photosynthetic reaction center cytochrome c subunit
MKFAALVLLAASAAIAQVSDLVSPITAAGVEEPKGFDWPQEKRDQPASKNFKNLKVLGDVSSIRLMAAMQSMRANLGETCLNCHLTESKNFASDEKKPKEIARAMIRMTNELDEKGFDGKPRVTCWTCHRGEPEPARGGFSRHLPEHFEKLSAAKLAQPAEKVFHDVRELKGMDARNFGLMMGYFSSELGVKCTHCHEEHDFAKDTPKKTRAREMLRLTNLAAAYFPKDDSPVGCGTCHRGQPEPLRVPDEVH